MNALEELSEEAGEVLEPNLQFYRVNPEDKNRYLVGPEVLQAIAWTATTIAVPLLMVGLSEVIKTYVKKWLEKKPEDKEADARKGLPPDVTADVEQLLTDGSTVPIEDAHLKAAVGAVEEFLSRRGWPKAFAAADAESIVLAVKQRLGKPS
ncbi:MULTISPECIES: hypothetical protein [Rhizobium]|uniref:hypothetical protein n=1 Tax=Rhizobium TaxID=379 RepID=UPI0014428E06|nr:MULTISPECIES: hypothetical protein [Rhizobium]NKL04187.1 hypothetical protein [Rhizobium leguminosarum bv. viciae]NKL85577.1 hypothetical protein [Rhizobium leguminosarum bv. viciae]NKL89351.1 hypothetical protein [Rhizobium leguminosarum bv. viciae]NKM70833.1 hypothetical protein [Rhizobium laguerreae]NKM90319.1 hypothetical protein [Rhizobium leguminosarum bv. viciae]